MKSLFIITTVITVLCSCSVKRNVNTLPADKQYSMFFRQLYEEVDTLTNGFRSVGNFRPDSITAERYSIYQESGEFCIRGYLITDSTFDKTSLDKIGIVTVMYNDTLYSYRCPLTRINDLIKASDIKIIDLDKRITINNGPI